LKLRRESKTLSVGTLLLGDRKLRLQPAAELNNEPAIAVRARSEHGVTLEGKSVSISFLARYLSARLQRMIVDRTGVAGNFDFTAELSIDPEDSQDPAIAERDVMAHLFGDLADSLGLKLKQQTASVDVFIVEQLELPAAN
jgi:uncharacterized protein (TIGR03435 family)